MVTGAVTPRIAEQSIRVDMTRPDGLVANFSATTLKDGSFSARLILYRYNDPDVKSTSAELASAVYSFQAHIINATDLAPADSNIVLYKVGLQA